jgi:hypothetical protein
LWLVQHNPKCFLCKGISEALLKLSSIEYLMYLGFLLCVVSFYCGFLAS